MIGFVTDSDVTLASFATKKYISMKNEGWVKDAIVSEQQTQIRLIRPGLTKANGTVSMIWVENPNWFLLDNRYGSSGSQLYWILLADSRQRRVFAKDATFTERADTFLNGYTAFQSVNYPDYYISYDIWRRLYIRRFQSTNSFKECASFAAIRPTGNRYT